MRQLPAREPAHTSATGVVLVVGGSREMTGAMRLVGTAARVGAGPVDRRAEDVATVVQRGLAEATTPAPRDRRGGRGARALGELLEAASRVDAVALGPGMGRADGAAGAGSRRSFVIPGPDDHRLRTR